MGKYYSPHYGSKEQDTQISGKYYHITDEYNEDNFHEPDEVVEEEYTDEKEYYVEERFSAKDILKSKTRNLFGF